MENKQYFVQLFKKRPLKDFDDKAFGFLGYDKVESFEERVIFDTLAIAVDVADAFVKNYDGPTLCYKILSPGSRELKEELTYEILKVMRSTEKASFDLILCKDYKVLEKTICHSKIKIGHHGWLNELITKVYEIQTYCLKNNTNNDNSFSYPVSETEVVLTKEKISEMI